MQSSRHRLTRRIAPALLSLLALLATTHCLTLAAGRSVEEQNRSAVADLVIAVAIASPGTSAAIGIGAVYAVIPLILLFSRGSSAPEYKGISFSCDYRPASPVCTNHYLGIVDSAICREGARAGRVLAACPGTSPNYGACRVHKIETVFYHSKTPLCASVAQCREACARQSGTFLPEYPRP